MNLPEINFVTADKEAVVKEIFALYTSVTGRKLAPADPIRLFLLTITNIVIFIVKPHQRYGQAESSGLC